MTISAINCYQGRAGDRNGLAGPGARLMAQVIAERLAVPVENVCEEQPFLNAPWDQELAAAFDDMGALAKRLDQVFQIGQVPVTALTRCAAAIATLPVVIRHNPEACVVWFDAHADLNTPQTSSSGYLGGMALSGPAGLWKSGLGAGLSVNNIVLVGARDMDACELALVESGRVKLVPPGVASWQDALAQAVHGRPVYVHLDCDVLEPGIVPTEYRVPGGLSLEDLRGACAALAQMDVVGLEIAEFQGIWAPGEPLVSPANLVRALEPLLVRMVSSSV